MTSAATLPRLNAGFLQNASGLLLPEKILQFGEGAFLRGFVDWMIHGMNRKGLFAGRVVVVQAIAEGLAHKLNEQDGVYTLLMRGVQGGKVTEQQEIVSSISRAIDPYKDFQSYIDCARNANIRFIVSNTTEAGIVYRAEDKASDRPPSSFPAKLTLLLLERYRAFHGDPSKGFVLLPCELIDRNGDKLRETVLQTAENWKLDVEFITWVRKANIFTNTLVDRIVTGYPAAEAEALWQRAGYKDELFNTAEPFHLWVIEGPASLAEEFPLHKAGFNVLFVNNIKPYRDRKVGILNAAHTNSALTAYLAGKNYVGECMGDALIGGFMRNTIRQEVIPTLALPQQELESYASSVFERFGNPFIQHSLLTISLNSVSKYKTRVLPSLENFVAAKGRIPSRLAFGLAALIAFYRGTEIRDGALIGHRDGKEYAVKDNLPILETFARTWDGFDGSPAAITRITDAILRQKDWWGKDLHEIPGLGNAVATNLGAIVNEGMRAALDSLERTLT